jgi:hypothetical protein
MAKGTPHEVNERRCTVAESKPVFLVVNLFRWMTPVDRHHIEDKIDEVLQAAGLGEVSGGGGFVGGVSEETQCDIDLKINDIEKAIPLLRQVLQELKVDPRTEIIRFEPEEIRYSVYEG